MTAEQRDNGTLASLTVDEGDAEHVFSHVDLPSIAASSASSSSTRPSPSMETGIVRGTGSGLLVALGRGQVIARRAKSCLVAPDAGDRVLCVVEGDEVFVLAVLEGETPATRIVVESDLKVQAAGRIGIASGEHVEISAAREIGLVSAKLRAHAQSAAMAIEDVAFVGRHVETQLQKAVVVVEQLEVRANRLLLRAKQAFRFVEGLDQVRAGVFDVRAESLAAIRGETTVVTARTVAKIDGEQVKIG